MTIKILKYFGKYNKVEITKSCRMQLKLMVKEKFIVFCAYIAMTVKLKINDLNFSKGKEKENS